MQSENDTQRTSNPRGFWCQFTAAGQCLDLIHEPHDESPGHEYVWIQEGASEVVEENERLRKAMRLAEWQHLGCGGMLTANEIVRAMREILTDALG